jgi:sulfite reductase (NADPH) hemoprotein beta-component
VSFGSAFCRDFRTDFSMFAPSSAKTDMAPVPPTDAAAAVAEAVLLTSDRLVHVEPSPFLRLPPTNTTTLRAASSDPTSLIANFSRTDSSKPIALLAPGQPALIARIVAGLSAIAKSPVVIHVAALGGDHAPLAAFRSTGLTLLYSASPEQARLNSFLAARIAIRSSQPVIHWFDADDTASLPPLDAAEAQKLAAWSREASSGKANGVNGETKDAGEPEEEDPSAPLANTVESSYASFPTSQTSKLAPHSYTGPENPTRLVIAMASRASLDPLRAGLGSEVGLLDLFLYRPLLPSSLLDLIPQSVTSILILDQSYSKTTRWSPLHLDVQGAFSQRPSRATPQIVSGILGKITSEQEASAAIQEAFSTEVRSSKARLVIGQLPTPADDQLAIEVPKHEQGYFKLLEQIFTDRLYVVNSPENVAPPSSSSLVPPTSPEFALGRLLAQLSQRDQLKAAVRSLFTDPDAAKELEARSELASSLSAWLANPASPELPPVVLSRLSAVARLPSFATVQKLSSHFPRPSAWIVGSDAWAYDLGASGIHHALASEADVNLLVVDSSPYDPEASARDAERRKKDIGLYAMNYGNAYVASVALYADYGQTMRALVDADRFQGPSVVLAYLPGGDSDETRALDVLKQTKLAIDDGYWPLYRWDPSREQRGLEVFELDSDRIKADLKTFLDRQNHLSQLSYREPRLSETLEGSLGRTVARTKLDRAREAFEKLEGAISGPPLLVLFASDGGAAEKLAKRLVTRAKLRGLGARAQIFDDFTPDDLALEPNVVFITSTAGQGEFPQNGRVLWKALAGVRTSAAGPTGGEGRNLDTMRFGVFGLGDSHYWPRPEDAHYYNKPAKDLDRRLSELGAQRLVDLGLGDDQDADGPQTGYSEWEPKLWKALEVGDVKVVEAEPEPITNEHIKIASNYLRGTIKEGLEDKSTGALAESDGQLTKFHGCVRFASSLRAFGSDS